MAAGKSSTYASDKQAESLKIPTGDAELIVWAERKREDGLTIDDFQAKQNLAFLMGQQWGVWDRDRKRFQTDRARRGDPNAPVRVTVNKVAGLVERVIARLTKDVPMPECRPVSDTDSDLNTAKVGTRILSHELQARIKLQQRLVELYFWAFPLGWSFFHVRWDTRAGNPVGNDEEGNPIPRGEIVLDEVPGFEMRLDPNARRWRDAMWCVRTVTMTKEAVFEQYGVCPEAEDSESMVDEWRGLSSQYSDSMGMTNRRNDRSNTGMVAVHQLWLRPGGRIKPDGLVVTWAGKTLLEKPMPFPYQHGRLPFVPFNVLPALGGSPVGRTWVTDLIPLQRDYNDARSREAMIRRQLSPKILAARGQIDPHRLTSRVEVIDYNPSGPEPKLMLPDGRWMAQFEQGMNRADIEMGDRAGQQDVSQGKAASTAAAASILALQEADETKLAITAGELRVGVSDVGYQVLMLVKQFWDEERTIRTWSRDGTLEVDQFSGADIADQLDVHVASESALPKSKSSRMQMADNLMLQGVLTDPRDYVRMLELPGTDFLLETLNRDSKQAEREHGHLLRLEPVEAKVWHNHAAHMATHDEFRKSEEYEKLEPNQQAWFDGHVQAHMQLYASLMMAQMGGPAPEEGGENPSGENGVPTDSMTGMPMNPNGAFASSAADQQGPIGGTGNPGPVPGQTLDSQAFRMGM